MSKSNSNNCFHNLESVPQQQQQQREVELRIIFLRIGEIDTLNEKFFAEILIEAKWEEPKLCNEFDQRPRRDEKELSSAPSKYWNPKIYIENALNDPNQAIHYKIKKEVRRTSAHRLSTSSTLCDDECNKSGGTGVSAAAAANNQSENDGGRVAVETTSSHQHHHYQELNNIQFNYYVYEYRKLKGFFFEKLELEYFPVDTQSMTIVITTYRSNREVRLVPNRTRKSVVNNKVNIDNNIWQLFQHVDVIDDADDEFDENDEDQFDEFVISDSNNNNKPDVVVVAEMMNKKNNKRISNNNRRNSEYKANSSIKFPMLRFECKAARRSGYFYWNAFLPIFLITSAVFTIFMIDPDKPQFRLPVTATLLLTSIMFKSSYSTKYLPTVNYLTSLDKYSLFSLVFIYSCLVWYGVVASLFGVYKHHTVNMIDKTFLFLLLLVYVIVHCVFYMWLRSAYLIRNSMVDRDEQFWRHHDPVASSPSSSSPTSPVCGHGEVGGNGIEDRSYIGSKHAPHAISPTVFHNLDNQIKPPSTAVLLNSAASSTTSGAGHHTTNNRRVSLNKRDSVFGTINNIDKITYYQSRNRRPSIAENFRFLLKSKSSKTTESKTNFARYNSDI